MFKFELGTPVWYMHGNKICNGTILARRFVEKRDGYNPNNNMFKGPYGIFYETIHDVFLGNEIFYTKQELIEYLIG